jgi:RNA polymerase sigma-70 factor, ECF subfamily
LLPEEIERLRPKLRFKVCYEVGFLCPDVDDIVQEAMSRFLVATQQDKVRKPEAAGAFLAGICRNVISEYRRRNRREDPMPDVVPEPQGKSIPESDLFEFRDAIAQAMAQLPERDRGVLRAFYLEEKTKEDIMAQTGMTDQNFRVVLFRAKEKFRRLYLDLTKHPGALRHSEI